jgi:hypothetical protein
MRTFWKRSANYAFPVNVVVRAMFCIAYACWMLPMTRPVWGVIGGFAWLLLGGFYRN